MLKVIRRAGIEYLYMCPTASQDSYEDSFVGDMDESDIYDRINI